MGIIKKPTKAILFTGILYNNRVNKELIFNTIENEFGNIILTSETFLFTETDYYEHEMSKNLKRVFIGINKLIDMEDIVDIKLKTNTIENDMFTVEKKRNVNIDPGYITSAKVVLATTKNFQHRIYLRDGIYAEVTLRYRKNRFEPWEWTFKDYRREESIEFFNSLRCIYRDKIKSLS